MNLVNAVIDLVNWSEVEVLRGSGDDLANSLRRFVQAGSSDEASERWWELEGVAFAQNTVYGDAVRTVDVMMAALADRPATYLRPWIIEVVRFVLAGGADANPSLVGECRRRADAGRWLLAAEAYAAETPDYRDAVLEVLSLIDPATVSAVSAAVRLGPWIS